MFEMKIGRDPLIAGNVTPQDRRLPVQKCLFDRQ